MHFQHEQVAGARQALRKTHHVIDMLFGRDGNACCDATDQRDVMRCHDGAVFVFLGRERDDLSNFAAGRLVVVFHHLDGSAFVGVHVDEALFVEDLELMFDGRGTFQSCGLADFTE